MRFEIQEKHIRTGRTEDCWHCPVALAIGEQTGFVASVDNCTIKIYGDPFQRFQTPPEVEGWIRAFDAYGEVTPMAFELDWKVPVSA